MSTKDELSGDLYECRGPHSFYIKRTILDSKAKELMKVALEVRSSTGALVYAARPYTTDVGQIKIIHDYANKTLARGLIKDVYTNNHQGRLSFRADILMIDQGELWTSVPLHNIYDFPQTGRYLSKLEPEVLNCSLELPKEILYDKEISSSFLASLKKRKRNGPYTIKIQSYQRGVYYVDLLNSNKESIIDHLKSQYPTKFEPFQMEQACSETSSETISSEETLCKTSTETSSYQQVSTINSVKLDTRYTRHRPKPSFRGALDYFKYKYKENFEIEPIRFKMLTRFFEVKVTSWDDPNNIYLIPRDPDYLKTNEELLEDIKTYTTKYNLDHTTDDDVHDAVYHVGEKCLFRNHYVENIGPWLRGVITEMPQPKKWCWLSFEEDASEENSADPDHWPYKDNLRGIVYRVRSVDYGIENVVEIEDLRKVKDMSLFNRKGSYSLRCRLFGVHPLSYNRDDEGKPAFSETCKWMIDAWMREKIVQDHRPQSYHALIHTLFHSVSEDYQSEQGALEIVLFHRFEPPKTIEDIYLPSRKRRDISYECLNTFLVDNGYATDDYNGSSTGVELDHMLLNSLSNRDPI